ncbi:MAG TPA: DUF1549 domain-containing protein, partial [Planctomycetaceae bacterium]|nr:DUF1549 domain-containing protein [Planctomycetaceae bacterium]
GNTESSELIRRIFSGDSDEVMPPPESKLTLTLPEKEALSRWIASGAGYQTHWAFKKPVRPAIPGGDEKNQHPIDAFIGERLRMEGLTFSPEASPERLIRRLTLDLTGLPPTTEEVAEFVRGYATEGDRAYEALLDRLMASPRYGEVMALPWLDAARFADTDGYQYDGPRFMWRWRDWVIDAYNANMPFDQFTIEQLAGDMLPDATLEQQIATGFGRNHRINSEGGSIPEEWAVEYVADRVETLGTIWLGLTLNCSRCHDHKFDDVKQNEFYQLYAYFNSVPEWGLGPNNGNSPPFVKVPASWPNLTDEENRLITPAPYEIVKTQTSVYRPKPGGPETVMVMQEMETPRPAYRLIRGMYDQPDTSQVLPRDVPESLRIPGVESPRNRLELARWLMHPKHPLTARVTVNRFWQKFFATGLVRSSENFGSQGELPS